MSIVFVQQHVKLIGNQCCFLKSGQFDFKVWLTCYTVFSLSLCTCVCAWWLKNAFEWHLLQDLKPAYGSTKAPTMLRGKRNSTKVTLFISCVTPKPNLWKHEESCQPRALRGGGKDRKSLTAKHSQIVQRQGSARFSKQLVRYLSLNPDKSSPGCNLSQREEELSRMMALQTMQSPQCLEETPPPAMSVHCVVEKLVLVVHDGQQFVERPLNRCLKGLLSAANGRATLLIS